MGYDYECEYYNDKSNGLVMVSNIMFGQIDESNDDSGCELNMMATDVNGEHYIMSRYYLTNNLSIFLSNLIQTSLTDIKIKDKKEGVKRLNILFISLSDLIHKLKKEKLTKEEVEKLYTIEILLNELNNCVLGVSSKENKIKNPIAG